MSSGSARSSNAVSYDAQSREKYHPYLRFLKGWAGLVVMVVLLVLLRCLQRHTLRLWPNQPDGRRRYDVVEYPDTPIPRPASPFAPVFSINRLPPPPDLGGPDSDPEAVLSSDISDVELLEEGTRAASENWRQIAQGLSISYERRTTFGLVVSVLSSIISPAH
jgi:hypothetical protein